MKPSIQQHRPLTPDICERIRVLRDNLLDLEIVRDDIDAEIVAMLAERERVLALMRQQEAELASLVRLAA